MSESVLFIFFFLLILVNVASGKGICLAPGFLNDHSGQFAWIPYDSRECFHCVLCTRKTDSRERLAAFIQTLQKRNGIEHINLVDFMRKGKNF